MQKQPNSKPHPKPSSNKYKKDRLKSIKSKIFIRIHGKNAFVEANNTRKGVELCF